MLGLRLLNCSFKFKGHLLVCVHLNGARNRGGGVLTGQQGWRRVQGFRLNQKAVMREQFEAHRNVFNLQSCDGEMQGKERGAVRRDTS